MKQYILITIAGMLLLNEACHRQPELYVKGTEQPVISLSGNWGICLAPYEDIKSSTNARIIWKI